MTSRDSVVVSVEVDAPPDVAFLIFTEDIDVWYRKDRNTLFDVDRTRRIAFEPFAGGRLLEIYDEQASQGREIARITAWEPGALLGFRDNHGTEVEIRFSATESGTRVTLEHSGFHRVPDRERVTVRRYGWSIVLDWYVPVVNAGARLGRKGANEYDRARPDDNSGCQSLSLL